MHFGTMNGKIHLGRETDAGCSSSTDSVLENAEIDLDEINAKLPGESKAVIGASKVVTLKKKKLQWRYYICCGICDKQLVLRIDATTEGRVSYFEKHHYNKCMKNQKKPKTKTLEKFTGFDVLPKTKKENELQQIPLSLTPIKKILVTLIKKMYLTCKYFHFLLSFLLTYTTIADNQDL